MGVEPRLSGAAPAPPAIAGVRRSFVDARGVRFHVTESGAMDGRPVIALHGWPQHHFAYRDLLADPPDGLRIIAPDLPGYGWSGPPPHRWDKEEVASDVLALLDALGLDRVLLIGHDWGGWVGHLLTLRAPERFDGYLCLNIAHPWQRRRVAMRHMWRFAMYQPIVAICGDPLQRRTSFVRRIIFGIGAAKVGRQVVDTYAERFRDPVCARAGTDTYRTFLFREAPAILTRPEMRRSHVPTQVLFGVDDIAVHPDLAAAETANADDYTVELVEDCGHFITDERPDLVRRALVDLASNVSTRGAIEPAERRTIRPRKVAFDYADTPIHWIPDDPQSSHVLNVAHLVLPAGERWFCDVYRDVVTKIDDPGLARDVKAFIGQEATHARAHDQALEAMEAKGIDHHRLTRSIDWAWNTLRSRSAPKWMPDRLGRWLEHRYLVNQLAVIATIEHFTAFLGWWMLDQSGGLEKAGADEEMVALLRWHGAEEVEHRSVAFDAYRALGGGYIRRCLYMLVIITGLWPMWFLATHFLIRQDKTIQQRRWLSIPDLIRAGRQGRVPTLGQLYGSGPRYLKPGFHPSQLGDTELASAYLENAKGVVKIDRDASSARPVEEGH